MSIWQPEFECLLRSDLEALQLERLQSTVRRCYEAVPFYRQAFDARRLTPADIRSLDDLHLLPFTDKEAFRTNYPYGLFAVPRRQLVRLHASSGTTGQPTIVGYTRRDLATWSDLVARFLVMAGVTDESVVQVGFGYGLFTGGFGLHYGIERVGALVVPASSGNTRRHLNLIRDLGTTDLVCTPSYALNIAEVAEEIGFDMAHSALRHAILGAEPWSEPMRREIERRLGVQAYDNYGLSEVMGPGVSGECAAKNGLHLFEDQFIPEVIDPQTLEPLPAGREGELVLTAVNKEALPVLRYRTRDRVRLIDAPCPCGRTLRRHSRVTGRTDDMLIIRGVNVFPSQIEEVLLAVEGTLPQYQILLARSGALDELEVKVEVNERLLSDEMKAMRDLNRRIEGELELALGLRSKVTLVEPGSLPRSDGKAKRVIDRRT
jgi:phenylacetate-CoA ligase